MKTAKQVTDGPAEPAVITRMHVQDRTLHDEKTGKPLLGKAGFRHETQFQRACRLGQLVDKAMCAGDAKAQGVEIERALDRRDAGKAFVEAWDIRERGTKDSLDLSRGGSAASAAGISDAQIDAGNLLASWERHLGKNDWMILRRVCGENCAIAQAVVDISPGYRLSTLARFREALDALHLIFRVSDRCRKSVDGCCSAQERARKLNVARETSS